MSKTRLQLRQETPEDVLMWLKLAERISCRDKTNTPVRFRCLSFRSVMADRHDAALMLALTECQKSTGVRAAAHRRERGRLCDEWGRL